MAARTATNDPVPSRQPGRSSALAPYLIATAFPLSMYLRNLAEEPTGLEVAATFALALALAALASLAARLVVRDAACRAVLAWLAVVGALGYGHAFVLVGPLHPMHRYFLPLWAALFGLAALVLLLLRGRTLPQAAARLVTVVSGFLVALQIGWSFPLLRAQFDTPAEASASATEADRPESETNGPPGEAMAAAPDIYYIILDGYARADVLRRLHGFDNGEFFDALRDRGFYVPERARSNYAQTQLSLPSMLSMDYLPKFPSGDAYELHYQEIRRLRKQGRAFQWLRDRGYRYRYVGSIFYPIDEAADEQLFPSGQDGGYLRAFVATTVFDLALRAMEIWDPSSNRYAIDQYQFEKIPAAKKTPGPTVTFAHIVLPHFPYLYDRDGRLPRIVQREEGSVDDYLEQVRYVNGRVMELIDAIDRTSGRDAVILFTADHGSDYRGQPDDPSAEQLFERMSIFAAYRVPERVRKLLYPTITPVNNFRVLFAGLFGADVPLLEDRSYYSSYDAPLRLIEAPPQTDGGAP